MANNLNCCMFIGNLGKDPEMRETASGMKITSFSIACGWKTKEREGTEWVNITTFGKLAEICDQYLSKGSKVFISGRFTTDRWEDKDGNTRYSTKIVADKMEMLSGKRDGEQQSTQHAPDEGYETQSTVQDDDVPF